jgi:hypothetical protein
VEGVKGFEKGEGLGTVVSRGTECPSLLVLNVRLQLGHVALAQTPGPVAIRWSFSIKS